VAQGGLPRLLVGREGIHLRCGSLLRDAEVSAVDNHEEVVEHVVHAHPALEDDLRLWGRQRGGGRGGPDVEKKDICVDLTFAGLLECALRPQRGEPSSPSTAVLLASTDPQHFKQNITPAPVPAYDFTHHNVDQVVGDGVDECPDPLAVGLRVDGAGRRADGRTPWALLGVHLHKMKGPKQVLRVATLWEEGVLLEQLPCFFDDEQAHPEKLTEVPRLCCRRIDTVRRPVHV